MRLDVITLVRCGGCVAQAAIELPPAFWAHDGKPAPAGLEILKLHQPPCRKIVLLTPIAHHDRHHVVAPQRIEYLIHVCDRWLEIRDEEGEPRKSSRA